MAGVWENAIKRVLPQILKNRHLNREDSPEGTRNQHSSDAEVDAGADEAEAEAEDEGKDNATVRSPRLLPLGDSLTLGVQGEGDPKTCNVTDQQGCLGGGYRSR